jgi:hypothetical protein
MAPIDGGRLQYQCQCARRPVLDVPNQSHDRRPRRAERRLGAVIKGLRAVSDPTTAKQADSRAVYLCIANAWRGRPLLPLSGPVVTCSLPALLARPAMDA